MLGNNFRFLARFFLTFANLKKAIVVSNDRFRDLRTPETEEQIRDR